MKKNSITICLAGFAAMICISCSPWASEAEYEALASTAFEPRTGMMRAQAYLARFQDAGEARTLEVESIYREYEMMADFNGTTFTELASLISAGQELDAELSMSPSAGVRTTWARIYADKRERTRLDILKAFGEIQFSPKLARAAEEFCEDTYLSWSVEQIREVGISPAELVDNGTAKCCSAEYAVRLRGNLLGIRTYDARVSVRGRYSFDSLGEPHLVLEDARILDGPATASEWVNDALSLVGAFLF